MAVLYPAGLNVNTRPTLLNILRSLHESRSLRIIMGLWIQDSVPDRLSHIALVMGETILTGVKDEILSKYAEHQVNAKEAEHRMVSTTQSYLQSDLDHGKPVVDMKNVNVSYGPRKVTTLLFTVSVSMTPFRSRCSKISNEPSAKAGAGTFKARIVRSGKTTLSLLTGDHPQSYTQQGDSNLELFSRPRQRIPTPLLRSLIAIVSPIAPSSDKDKLSFADNLLSAGLKILAISRQAPF
ncbi:hypothetical protein BDR06DRAFT_1010868 [Suillus hirtellus]|nr:hypothetical protein BDR06DRAFT_1010868 [Suillus hirtellus]